MMFANSAAARSVIPVRQDRAGRSLRPAEARCSLQSCAPPAGCDPNWMYMVCLAALLNSES